MQPTRKEKQYNLIAQQIDDLKNYMCPEQFKYAREYLDLALIAVMSEGRLGSDPCSTKNGFVRNGLVNKVILH